ncbi:hypothetical protein BGY98DRAFT_956011 [Russula aff. rugulosa BPL654]|nr:hypothetical protein BGY98DRAFT_956011 [Russula aff. rugulosa BPL654]
MVDCVNLRIEMQTASSKVLLADIGGPTLSLVAGDTLESTVHHEIKELGQHVLACTVSYQLPPGARRPATSEATTALGGVDTGDDNGLQTFANFTNLLYVTNPLSVKTKVHMPRALKVFLEVHIQNLTSDPMWFERIILEPAPSWSVQDANLLPDSQKSLFSDGMALMQPQDTRQYIYILNEINPPAIPVRHDPGVILPLGRLDISWRSSFGEPGRLLTSMLSRRIPLPSNQPPRSASVTGHTSQPPSRPGTPPTGPVPYRSSSPFRHRPMSVPPRPQSPGMSTTTLGNIISGSQSSLAVIDPVDVDLVVRSIPQGGTLQAGKSFSVTCTLGVSAFVREGQQRTLSLAVQHVQPSTAPTVPAAATETTTPAATNARLASALLEHEEDDTAPRQRFPPPRPMHGDEARYDKLRGATRFLGASTLLVPPMTLVRTHSESELSSVDTGSGGGDNDGRGDTTTGTGAAATTGKEVQFWDFELEYTPLRTGFVPVGGLRVLLVEDRVQGADEVYPERRSSNAPVVLKEWDVIGEIWVKS